MARLGAYKHKSALVAERAIRQGGTLKTLNVNIRIGRWTSKYNPYARKGVGANARGNFYAQACFYRGGTAAIEERTARGRQWHGGRPRARAMGRLFDRCARGDGNSPSQAVKRALRALSKKKF